MRIGVSGWEPHRWQSVERTRRFYLRALSSEYELCQLDNVPAGEGTDLPDAIVNFTGSRYWQVEHHPACPLIFGMHGGAIINQSFLRAYLPRLETGDVLLVNCTSDQTILAKMFEGEQPHICHLPLPVDSEVFQPLDRQSCREALPIQGSDYVVGFVSRLLPQKNLHQFLYMLAEIKRSFAPRTVTGIVIGQYWTDYPILDFVTGEYPAIIARLVGELELGDSLAYFPTVNSDEELAVFYGAMDLLFHPTNSIDENFGYVPVEAMACGTPVIGAAYGGLKDTVVSGHTGYLMPTWITPAGIRMDLMTGAEQAIQCLTNPGTWARWSHAAVEWVRTLYSYERCANILRRAVADAIAQRHSTGSRAVVLAESQVTADSADLLPPIRRPWREFQGVVAEYVSQPCPALTASTLVRLAGPVVEVRPTQYRLEDPAWPATFHLHDQEAVLLDECRVPVAVAQLTQHGRIQVEQIERLLRLGLLICAAEPYLPAAKQA